MTMIFILSYLFKEKHVHLVWKRNAMKISPQSIFFVKLKEGEATNLFAFFSFVGSIKLVTLYIEQHLLLLSSLWNKIHLRMIRKRNWQTIAGWMWWLVFVYDYLNMEILTESTFFLPMRYCFLVCRIIMSGVRPVTKKNELKTNELH